MGEPQPQSPKPENPNPIPPQSNDSSSSSASVPGSTTIEAPRITELSNVSSPPSKIPLRPRKIRKLSPNNDAPPRIHAKSLTCEGELEAAITHLRSVDPLLASLIDAHPPPKYESFNTPFLALIRSILYQQLAAKAGNSIYTRFVSLCGGENGVAPENVLPLTPQELRQIGVSGRKASYLHDLARKYQNGILSDSGILNMDDKSLFTMLTMVNGIGSWSVHMFMMNSLHRPDVLPVNDLGVRKGVQMLYDLPELPRPSQMDGLCEKWRPYRSVGSWYMWRLIEAKGTPSNAGAVSSGADLAFPQLEDMQQQQQSQLLDPLSVFSIGYSQLLYLT
ncbi:hypothetical protein F2Q69_00050276 [Brassica cretica]|uniref:HhH-GPD domain-containing protein n=1 Tax=Brassica cretica TaxID=69181 RepID=A0A8S9PQ04_BRACR|nr:hypothetical protein F2Q69_00050276 [Brassica cretica]